MSKLLPEIKRLLDSTEYDSLPRDIRAHFAIKILAETIDKLEDKISILEGNDPRPSNFVRGRIALK